MIVLGIDPGSRQTGYAFLQVEGRKITYLDSGVLKFTEHELFLDRVGPIYDSIKQLILKLNPDVVAMESLIFVKSPTALIKLAQTRGVILSALYPTHQGKIFEYSPNLVKSSTSGHGHTDKEGMQRFLNMVLGERVYKTHDESDALAIALCHIVNINNKKIDQKLLPKPKKGRSLKASLAHKLSEKVL